MGQALYRKYRPKSLGEAVGQAHITDTLAKAIKSGRISHAYLFTGPRGVGKTSIARILAHEINGLPYTDDSTHLDIIEIDAASNRRIDEIRDLRDRVNIAPTSAKYKVYIIDEVHMLTREAFNALLKTLEEPPAHVVFILATTEAHKLPETIVSRTQRFTFKPVPLEQVAEHLRMIADKEKIDIDDAVLELIAQHGEGSFRDSISLLDQAGGQANKVDAAYVQTMLGVPPFEAIQDLMAKLAGHDAAGVVTLLAGLQQRGFGPAQIAKQLGAAWRDRILDQATAGPDDFELLQSLLNVPGAHDPERYLEITLLEFALKNQKEQSQEEIAKATPKQAAALAAPTAATQSIPAKKNTENKTTLAGEKPDAQPSTAKAQGTKGQTAPLDASVWPQVLDELKKNYNTLYSVARMAQPNFTRDSLELGFAFAFHRKRVSEAKNQAIIAEIIERLTGQAVTITCVEGEAEPTKIPEAAEVAQAAVAPAAAEQPAPAADLASISNIFGGGELLQS